MSKEKKEENKQKLEVVQQTLCSFTLVSLSSVK